MSLEILYNYELSHIKKKQDAVVCFVHSWLITKGFKCIGKGEEIPKDNIRQSDMLPPGWSADDIYSLIYQRQTTGDTYLLEIVNFDSTLLHFMRIKDMKVSSTEVNPSDYVTNNLSSFDGAFHKQSLDSFSKRLTGELLGLFEEKPKAVPHEKVRSPDRHHPDPCRVPYARPEWEQPTNPWSIGRSDLDPLDGGMGSGMIFDPMRTGFPSYGGPGRGTGGPNILPRDERPPQSSSPSSSAGAITAANNPSSRRWMPVNVLQATSFSNQSERNDGIFRKVRGILNKLTPEKFDKLSLELLNVGIESQTVLKGIILLIFEKALDEPKYSSLYAQLCHRLCEDAPNFEPPSSDTTTFRKLLLSKCQDEFQNRSRATEAFERDGPLTAGEMEQCLIAKHKMLGNIKFIGELGKLEMLHEGILHKCIKQLLEKKKMAIKDMSEDMECLCQIMRTVGKRLDHEKAKLWMDAYFERMKAFQANEELPSRVRFMLQDVIELRHNRWQPRRNLNDGAPKTIQQVREEVAKESGVFIPRQQLYLHDEMNRGLSHTFKKLSSVAQFEQKEKELFQLLAYRDKDLAAATSQIADLTAKLNLREFQLRESTHRNSALLRQLSRWQYNYSELSRELEYIKNEREQEDTELKVVDNLPSSDGSFTSVASCMDGSGREGQLECTVNTFDGNNTLGEGIVEAFSQQQENIIDILVYDTLPSGTMEGCGGMGGPGHRGRGRGRVRLL